MRRLALLCCAAAAPAAAKPVVIGTYDHDVYDSFVFMLYTTFWCGDECAAARQIWSDFEQLLKDAPRVFVGEVPRGKQNAFRVHALWAPRGAGVFLNFRSKF